MSKLSKREAKLHNEAMALVRSGRALTEDEQALVLDQFQEGAAHMNGLVGAFFTPRGLARDFAIEVVHSGGSRRRKVLDLCAGIGGLSWACEYGDEMDFVCVERNPDYVEVGRVVMPRATWVTASIFDVDAYKHLGPFDVVISNPPFGRIPAQGFEGKYTGASFELRTIELASRLGRRGVFIVSLEETDDLRRFREQTGDEWHGTSPAVEIVCVDFEPASAAVKPGQRDLFTEAA
ncbi:MAG TPA: methyltransferase [Archangium sp.]